MRIGIADHFGWAVAVTATAEHRVVDRRRIELVEPDVTPAPVHYDRGQRDESAMVELVGEVRASIVRATSAALDELQGAIGTPIVSMALRTWPTDFPTDIAVLRRPPYEARADAVVYRQVLSELAFARHWDVHLYEAKHVEAQAVEVLGARARDVLRGPRAELGPPWAKDHRIALAATIVGG